MATCSHLDHVLVTQLPEAVDGCEDCLATGGQWLHLRICLECGKVGCCDDSPNRHATAHARESGHPIIRSLEPGEEWSWCFADDLADADPRGPGQHADPAVAAAAVTAVTGRSGWHCWPRSWGRSSPCSTRRRSTSRCRRSPTDLGGGLAGQQWVANGYVLALAALILVGGSLGDIYGERRVFSLGLIGFGVTSLACALAPSIGVLVAARIAAGRVRRAGRRRRRSPSSS